MATSNTIYRGQLSGYSYIPPGGSEGQVLTKASDDDGDVNWAGEASLSVLSFGTNTTPGTTDMTDAFNSAIAAGISSGRAVHVPAGTYLITRPLNNITGWFRMFGDGKRTSIILFNPTEDGSCITLRNGTARVEHVVLADLCFRTTNQTYTKVALDLYDMSVCAFERIVILGNGGSNAAAGACWSGNGSIGIRTHGREATSFTDIEIVADRCFVIDQNPNTVPNDGEDLDHFSFRNFYLVGNGYPLIQAVDGIGVINLTIDGYQAWVGGDGGFKMNDTRTAPTIISRNISISNVRTEQMTNAAKTGESTSFAIDIGSTFPMQQFRLENCLFARRSKGIRINAADHIVLQNITTAMAPGIEAVNITAQNSRATLAISGCYFGDATSLFTLTNYDNVRIDGFTSANYSGPNNATYVFDGQLGATSYTVAAANVECANGATGLTVTGTTGDVFQVNPQAAGNGVSLRAVNNAKSDWEPLAITGERVILRHRVSSASTNDGFILYEDGSYGIVDGVSAPATAAGYAKIFVDSADGDLKVKFGDGTTKTIVTDT